MSMRWQRSILEMLKTRENKTIALAIDTSTKATKTILINNIVQLFKEVSPDCTLVQADFKIRDVGKIASAKELKWYDHGKSSYTEVLEWGENENIDTLFYITDVTGYFYDELQVNYEVVWLVPDDFLPKVPFGKAIKVA